MSEVEGIGEAVTGALAARAIEPGAGETAGEGHGKACLNCGTTLTGRHCHECGQAAHVHRTVSAWWHDVLHSVLHFEGKMWRTLPMLAWRPGELTRRYVEGERARFVSPMALFLFTVFLMFALFGMLGASLVDLDGNRRETIAAELRRADAEVARIERERAERAARGESVERLDEALREARSERQGLALVSGEGGVLPDGMKTGWARLDAGLKKAGENPALLSYKLQSSAYKYSWALIPLSLPFLWMLFLHRKRYRERLHAYDHLVFITYSIAFMSMVLIAFVLLRTIGVAHGLVTFAFLLVPPVHMYRQLKGAYALSRASALWRTIALLFISSLTVTLFGLLLLGLGLLS
ncbi:MAG TPA: DUF3667 domain-containing protein [Allosphingosinicella sp.]|nr:DUF3667 domain-containing protein [Allosphingosinicella sp.]